VDIASVFCDGLTCGFEFTIDVLNDTGRQVMHRLPARTWAVQHCFAQRETRFFQP
jgi:hypothetical protein